MDNPNLPQRQGLVVGLKKFTESMRHNLQCNICLDYFVDPVTTRCNHQFCRKCILKSLIVVGPLCPICQCVTSKRSLVPKENLTAIVKAVKAIGLEIEGALFSQDVVNHINPGTKQAKKSVPSRKEKNPKPGKVKKLSTKSCPVGPTILTQLENMVHQAEAEEVEVKSGSSTLSLAHDGQNSGDSIEVLNDYENHCHVDDDLDSDNLVSASQAIAPEPMPIQRALFQETSRPQLPGAKFTPIEKVNEWLAQTETSILLVSEDGDEHHVEDNGEEGGGDDDDYDTVESSTDERFSPKSRFFKFRKGQQPAAKDLAGAANPAEKETVDPFRFVGSQKTPPNKRKGRRPSVYQRRMSYSKVDLVRHFKSKAYDPNPTTCKQQQQQQSEQNQNTQENIRPANPGIEESFPVNVRDRFDEVLLKSQLRQWPTLVNGTKVARSTSSSTSSSTNAFANLMVKEDQDSVFLFRSPDAVQPHSKRQLLEKENVGVALRKRKIVEKRQAGQAETRKRAKVTPAAAAGAATTFTQTTVEVIDLSPQTVAPINSNIDDVILPIRDSKQVNARPTVDKFANSNPSSVEIVSGVELSVQLATSQDLNDIGANIPICVEQQQQSANLASSQLPPVPKELPKDIDLKSVSSSSYCPVEFGVKAGEAFGNVVADVVDGDDDEHVLKNDDLEMLIDHEQQQEIIQPTTSNEENCEMAIDHVDQQDEIFLTNDNSIELATTKLQSSPNPGSTQSPHPVTNMEIQNGPVTSNNASRHDQDNNQDTNPEQEESSDISEEELSFMTRIRLRRAIKAGRTSNKGLKVKFFLRGNLVRHQTLDSTLMTSSVTSKSCQTEKSATKLMTTSNEFFQTDVVQSSKKSSSGVVSKCCQTEVIPSMTSYAVSKLCQTDESTVFVPSSTSRACQTDVIESTKPTSAGSCHECAARRLTSATLSVGSTNPSELTLADQVVGTSSLNTFKEASGFTVDPLADTDIEEAMEIIVTQASVPDVPLHHECASGSEIQASNDYMDNSLDVNEKAMDTDENNKAAEGPATTMESDDCVVQVASEDWGQTQLHPSKMAGQEGPTAAPASDLYLHSPQDDKHNADPRPSNQEDPASIHLLAPEVIVGNPENPAFVSPELQDRRDFILDANNSLSQPFSEELFSPSPIQARTTSRRPLTMSTPISATSANKPSSLDTPVKTQELLWSSPSSRAKMPAWKLRVLKAKLIRMRANAIPTDDDVDDDEEEEEEIDKPEQKKSIRIRFKRIHVLSSSDTDVDSQEKKPLAKVKSTYLYSPEHSVTQPSVQYNDQNEVIRETEDLYECSTPMLPALPRPTHRVIIADDNVDDSDENNNENNSLDNSSAIERIIGNAAKDLNILKDSKPENVEDEQNRSSDLSKRSSQDTVIFNEENMEGDEDKETMDISAMTTQFQSTDMSTETQYLDTQACEKLEGEIVAEVAQVKQMEQQLITKQNVKHDDHLPDVDTYHCNTQTKNDISLNSQSIGAPEDPSASSGFFSKDQADLEPTAEKEPITASGSTAVSNPLKKAPGNMVFVTSMLSVSEQGKVKRMAARFSAKWNESFTENTTHVILKTDDKKVCQRSLKYLMGVARHCFVVSYDWTVKCMASGRLVPEDDYEIAGDNVNKIHHGPHRSRLSTVPIFKDHEFHCIGLVNGISEDDWFKLLSWSGATQITHPSLFTYNKNRKSYIIMAQDPKSETDIKTLYQKYQVPVLDHDWVLNSLVSYILEPVEKYLQHPASK